MTDVEMLYAICQSEAKLVQTDFVLKVLDELSAKIAELQDIANCDHDYQRVEYKATLVGVLDIRKCKHCGWEKDFGYYDGK